ncbi:hypothetical protein M8C21_023040 [Ambrosia artemisiifolia]|uniref:Uncharacterized protein n=1 Tax=Ambrosia artemisiifolia TaxID=4212 RepID=A0AAD5G7V4_AMBAR|nr:hypothetical protein M8C21_023040 [Ambrosia artemisiifolia]
MQSILNNGLPLCLAGVTCYHQLTRTKRIADHDRRREEFRRAQPRIRETEGVIRSLDLMTLNHDDDVDQLSIRHTTCAAKAA